MQPDPAIPNLPDVIHQGMPVLTTELLARVYGVEPKIIHDGFSRNADRFHTGVHYFDLSPGEIKALKDRPALSGLVGKTARSLRLWTERGAARHAKPS